MTPSPTDAAKLAEIRKRAADTEKEYLGFDAINKQLAHLWNDRAYLLSLIDAMSAGEPTWHTEDERGTLIDALAESDDLGKQADAVERAGFRLSRTASAGKDERQELAHIIDAWFKKYLGRSFDGLPETSEWLSADILAAGFRRKAPDGAHVLYKREDKDAPEQIKDRNGDIVLDMCRICGRAESELTEPCGPRLDEDCVPTSWDKAMDAEKEHGHCETTSRLYKKAASEIIHLKFTEIMSTTSPPVAVGRESIDIYDLTATIRKATMKYGADDGLIADAIIAAHKGKVIGDE